MRYETGVRSLVVMSSVEPCPYLPAESMRLPYRLPLDPISPAAFDEQLALGDRRAGPLFYRPACPTCNACQPIRVAVDAFAPTRSQRRVARRNDGSVTLSIDPPIVDERVAEIYNAHKQVRALDRSGRDLSVPELQRSFFDVSIDSRLVRYKLGDHVIAFSVLDLGLRASSSVYHAFDARDAEVVRRSIGVYSVLAEIAICKSLGLQWYYLGLYVEACDHLNYKADYHPSERRIDGVWQRFEAPLLASSNGAREPDPR